MDTFEIVVGVICLVMAIAIFVYFWRVNKKLDRQDRLAGTLRIDTSDPDGPYMFLELSEPVYTILNEEYVRLKVNKESYISRQ